MINQLVFSRCTAKFMLAVALCIQCGAALAASSAVVLQYHHVSANTPSSTSISPKMFKQHLDWLKENHFTVLPLSQVVDSLRQGKQFASDKVVAITFDDANLSVCDTAWPILKKRQLPFTVFISTEAVDSGFKTQCSWSVLQEMAQSGLMTPANHSHRHLNMISSNTLKKQTDIKQVGWKSVIIKEVQLAQELIQSHVGSASQLFAYPYGEYNTELSSLITRLGFVGFGQHSGAIGEQSDFSALPRFPASGQHANLDTLKVKLLSLPFPAVVKVEAENPIKSASDNNPPKLVLVPNDSKLLATTTCYDSQGVPLPSTIDGDKVIVQSSSQLTAGRHRYTCTSKSPFPNRFYWVSHQWLVE